MAFDLSTIGFGVRSAFPAFRAGVVLCLAFAGYAPAATIISGSANITGNINVTANTIQFFNGSAPNTFAPNGASTGSYAGLTAGTIQELFLATEPVNTPVNVIDFATFLGGTVAQIDFDLTFIQPGFGTLAACASSAVGAECTPANSPLTFIQGQQGVAVFFSVEGTAYPAVGGTGATGSQTIGSFTSQFNLPGTIPAVLAQLQATGISGQSYSANFTSTPTPEPSTGIFFLFGAVLVGISFNRGNVNRHSRQDAAASLRARVG